jgi:hypothetical protein
MMFYHGGVGGLDVGDKILPPQTTGVKTFAEHSREMNRDWAHVFGDTKFLWRNCNPARVYVSTDRETSREYAAMYTKLWFLPGNGALYQVTPCGPVSADPGMPSTAGVFAYECSYAVVEGILEPSVPNEPDPITDPLLANYRMLYLLWLRRHKTAL